MRVREEALCGLDASLNTQAYNGEFALSQALLRQLRLPVVRLLNEQEMGYCTGFLIAPDLVATASHCVRVGGPCSGFDIPAAVEFDYNPAGSYDPLSIAVSGLAEDVWCATGTDFAVLRLATAVPSHYGLVQFGTQVTESDAVISIGFPAGGSQFVSPGTVVEVNYAYLNVTIDMVGGMSGGPIFNQAGALVGQTALGSYDQGVCSSHPHSFTTLLDSSPALRNQFTARILTALF